MAIRLTGRAELLNRLRREEQEETRRQMQLDLDRLLDDLRAATPRDTGEAANGWSATRVGAAFGSGEQVANITNPVEYIQRLNQGSSQQAPARFIENAAGRYFTQIRPLGGRR